MKRFLSRRPRIARHRRAFAAILLLLWPLANLPAADSSAGSRKFEFQTNDVVVFTGGADTVAAQADGCLEVLLTVASADRRVRFRGMGWEGDTVYEQRRDLNFPPWPEQLRKTGATVVFAAFGQMESLQGKESIPRFVAAYGRLLDEFSKEPRRIVLLSPHPFEPTTPPLPDHSARNAELRQFVEAIREIARQRGCQFVDLFGPLVALGRKKPLTGDGVNLSAYGHWIAAREIVRQLGHGEAANNIQFEPATGVLLPQAVEKLRQSVLSKNRLWFDYSRPMNWAFLHGDRTEQPSSRDHRDRSIRWFPAEMEKFVPLIQEAEARIAEATAKIRTQ